MKERNLNKNNQEHDNPLEVLEKITHLLDTENYSKEEFDSLVSIFNSSNICLDGDLNTVQTLRDLFTRVPK